MNNEPKQAEPVPPFTQATGYATPFGYDDSQGLIIDANGKSVWDAHLLLNEYSDALRQARDGHSPKDALPKEGQRVLCEYEGVFAPMVLTYGCGGFGCPWLGDSTRTPVTRWWPLPGKSHNEVAERRAQGGAE